MKNVYLVERTDEVDYDEYFGFVIICDNEDIARKTHPRDKIYWKDSKWLYKRNDSILPYLNWVGATDIDSLKITLIGTSELESQIVFTSFNAG